MDVSGGREKNKEKPLTSPERLIQFLLTALCHGATITQTSFSWTPSSFLNLKIDKIVFLLLHGGVRQLLPVDDQVGVVGGLQGKAPVADPTAVAFLLVLLHDVLQVLPAFGKRQLQTKTGENR